MTEYAPGTPSWVDLATTDPEGSERFYTELFGWSLAEPRRPEFGGYRNFHDDGRLIAGLNPMGEHPVWTTYVSVDDAEATAARISEHGGNVMFEPMDVADLGRMAICQDPQGAVFGLWQPGAMRGADKVNDPVSLCWNELHSDREAAKPFYEAVFGWRAEDVPMGEEGYTVFHLGDRPIGGAGVAADPPHWLVWFSVVDADATAAKAEELGATKRMGPMDVPTVGRLAVFVDPQGAVFGILQGETPDE